MDKKRRNVIRSLAIAPALLASQQLIASGKTDQTPGARLQYSVNAYSFNSLLRSGEMTFFDLMEFAADIGLNAVDLTGYYFPSYPDTPPTSDLFLLKRKALELGLNISWTGVRNNFVNPDPALRVADRELIRNWLTVSSKLGASIMRIFDGKHSHDGFTRDEVKNWLVEEYKICAKYAEETGVILGLQNHNEFLLQSDEVIDILKRVESEWFGLILDIGSLNAGNTYDEIEKLAPYASYWFIKEHVSPKGIKTPVDMKKIATIIKNQGYQGYISFESLSEGDPKQIVSSMFTAFKEEYEKL
ncbi:sugar phosphate isomerase/epimerase [Algoriphagus ratkowskyi]|uniref:Sugar phosphate isomerase/epimerase n=1 Tax=Algoriphagus ratkowskyi TaxID=57028 RepID=A0A2W7RYG0_9BACT|nr:sugar phosphate isomerase/epimerase family protein [Algoriphagus ratkowskyi]PZX55945.1 sugar phosphate isomerase/epimerase [Algoriphagus ratkowskyi]TXD77242.1 sugar phosphate isomerase/epimerase [Algoriphagus ratkowskyi]